MIDVDLFKLLGLTKIYDNLPHYCGRWKGDPHTSVHIDAWECYGKNYSPSYVGIDCPLLEGGQLLIFACGNEFTQEKTKRILNTYNKCLKYYK